MKEIVKNGLSLFWRTVIVAVMCFFISISMSVLCSAAFTGDTLYQAYGYTDENSEEGVELYKYNTADGEDTQKAKYEAEGYKVKLVKISSELTPTGNKVFLAATQIFNFLILVSFVYPSIWQLGCKDSNLVRFKHKSEDIFKGLKIGLVASVPPILSYIALIVLGMGVKPDMPSAFYKFMHCQFFSFIELIIKGKTTVGDLGIVQYILLFLLLLILPATAFVSYLLGYKDISLSERFIYKKNKDKR